MDFHKSRSSRSLASAMEYLSIYQDHPFQDSNFKSGMLVSLNPCENGPFCNNILAEQMGTTCSEKVKSKAHLNNEMQTRPNSFAPKTPKRKTIHVRLGKIESKEIIEYKVEYPLRAAVQLQYLMHSTKVLLNEPEFMDKMYDNLIIEESKGLKNTTKEREQAEKDRVKALVIAGEMLPPPDMEYLYDHPVFKVNIMLNQLEQHSKGLLLGPKIKEKITPVEPYEFDGNKFFSQLHQKGTYWIPSEELVAEEYKLRGKIARAKLRLQEKRAKEEEHDKMMRILYENDADKDAHPETGRGSDVSMISNENGNDRRKEKSIMLQNLTNESDRQAAYFRRRRMRLEKEEEARKEKASVGQRIRDRVYLEAKELERQAYIARHYQRIKSKTIPENIELMVDASLLFNKPTTDKFANAFTAPATPPDVVETQSFENIRRYFDVRGSTQFGEFKPFNNPLIERYVDAAKKVDEILEGGTAISDLFQRQQLKSNDLLRKMKRFHNS